MTTIFLKSNSQESLLADFLALGIELQLSSALIPVPFGTIELIGIIPKPLTETQELENLAAQKACETIPHRPDYYEGYHANIYCNGAELPDWSCMPNTVCVAPNQPYRQTY